MKRILIIGAVCLFASCDMFSSKESNNDSKQDPFYTDNGGFGIRRIPLIKPYELKKVSANEWRMELLTTDVSLSIHNTNGVNITKGKILLHSKGGTDVRFKQYDEAWFIIDSSGKRERAFLSYKEYTDSLYKLEITDTALKLPDAVYKNFNERGNVEWHQ